MDRTAPVTSFTVAPHRYLWIGGPGQDVDTYNWQLQDMADLIAMDEKRKRLRRIYFWLAVALIILW